MIISVFIRTRGLIASITTSIITAVSVLQGGGDKAERTETMLTETETLLGGGGKAERTEILLTETVILSLGSYP